VLYTGQQKDIGEFEYDESIEIPDGNSNRLNSVIATILDSNVFQGVHHVIVQGDTASSFAVCLAAYNRGISISHIEAGLRTFDKGNPFPEECYRQMISSMASYHFCPTRKDMENLIREGIAQHVWVTGNTVIDTLPALDVTYEDTVLITMHRRENHSIMEKWFIELENLAMLFPQIDFVIPLHPNPAVVEASRILKRVKVIDPVPHGELLKMIAKSKMVITDSGGIQEEAAFYNKRVLVCRTTTERPALNQTMVRKPNDLVSTFEKYIKDYQLNTTECPFGTGDASERIYNLIMENLNV
jgi:UDP-N-acetylglucosamine 2-epimerase